MLRLHVDRENYAAIPDFLETCRTTFDADPRFRLFLRPLSRFGGANDDKLPVFEEKEAAPVIATLKQKASSLGLRLYEPEARTPICYAAHANSFVVRADGQLNKCTLALDDPRNVVGRLLPDGRVSLQAERMSDWMRGLRSFESEELRCPMRGMQQREPKFAKQTVPITVVARRRNGQKRR